MKIVAILGDREEYLACEVLKGLHRMGVELITSKPLNEYKVQVDRFSSGASNDLPLNQPHYTDDEMVEHSKDADYIFVFWNRFNFTFLKIPLVKIFIFQKYYFTYASISYLHYLILLLESLSVNCIANFLI